MLRAVRIPVLRTPVIAAAVVPEQPASHLHPTATCLLCCAPLAVSMRILALVSLAVASAATAQNCSRPFGYGSGAALSYEQQVQVVYSDGYVTNGTMVYPSVPPPTCGWPLVVYVHRLGQVRFEDPNFVSLIADHGYAVWAYDVRGQGSGRTEPANAALPTNGT